MTAFPPGSGSDRRQRIARGTMSVREPIIEVQE
jgi:hypothetical protein